eukprot:Pompholyxophrys_punicea_v1_NODE_1173_length_888_cov_3.831933.p1 type:complete len:198 gc:universal NODE_1173_length_888_cov_3.831933:698-105(-)
MWFYFALASALLIVVIRRSKYGLRGLAIGGLNIYKKFNLLLLRIQGLTPDDVVEQRVVSGQAWEEFCDTLKAAGASIVSQGTPKDGFNQAEGYRYLSRLVRAGLENFECGDPLAPRLVAIVNGRRAARICIGADNPDNLYENAVISGNYTYRVFGKRGTVHYLGFGTQVSYFRPKYISNFIVGSLWASWWPCNCRLC